MLFSPVDIFHIRGGICLSEALGVVTKSKVISATREPTGNLTSSTLD